MSEIAITTLDVPTTFCFTSWQQSWPTLVSLLMANQEGNQQFINFGSTTPVAEDQDKPWFRTNADGTPDKFYSYSSGNWLALHPIAPGLIVWWNGALASVPTLDGGEAGAVSPTTGPFWEQLTQMDGRFPLGPGTLTDGTVVAVGGTGGNQKVTLNLSQIPAHTHTVKIGGQGDVAGGSIIESVQNPDSPQGQKETLSAGGDAGGNTVAHDNMPPYYGIYALKRSTRLYYRI